MDMIPVLTQEFEQEAEITRKFLPLIPDHKLDWKPHEKNMSLKALAVHIAEIPQWTENALTTHGMDFADGYEPTPINSTDELVELFEESVQKGKEALEAADESDLQGEWSIRNGDQVFMTMTKYETIRHALNQTTHHRAQLGMYLRLLDIPIPGSYGPSADDQQGF